MKTREFLRKSQFPLMVALATYPLVTILLVFAMPERIDYAWIAPAVYAVLAIVMLALPKKLHIPFCVFGALVLTLPCWILPKGPGHDAMMVIGIVYIALLFWTLQIPGWEPYKEFPAGLAYAGLAVGLFGCLLATYGMAFAAVVWEIRLSFVFLVLLTMLSMNRSSLNLAAGDNWSFAAPMRWKNLLLTVGLFAVALAIAMIPHVFDLLAAVFNWIKQLIDTFREMLTHPEETTQQIVMETTIVRATAENWRDVILEGIETKRTSEQMLAMMTAIVLVVMVPVLALIAYRLIKWLIKLLHGFVSYLEQTTNVQLPDFVDEITDTREDSRWERIKKKKQRKPALWLRNMSPAEKIRYRYRRLRTKHPEWKDHETVRENLPEEAAQLYERARYSDHPITAGDADQFRNKTK